MDQPQPSRPDPNSLAGDNRASFTPGKTGPKRGWWPALIVAAAVAIVMVPLLIGGANPEIARWHAAAAYERFLEDDPEGAYAALERALSWNNESVEALQVRSHIYQHYEKYEESLADLNRVVELNPDDESALMIRAMGLQFVGRHPEAIADWKNIVRLSRARDRNKPSELNGLAYARALGNEECELALQDVEQALRVLPDEAGILDTRGYLYFRLGKLDLAEPDLDRAVKQTEEAFAKFLQEQPSTKASDLRKWKLQQQLRKRELAVIRYHRALVRQQLENEDGAEEDLQRVRELGCEPGERLF